MVNIIRYVPIWFVCTSTTSWVAMFLYLYLKRSLWMTLKCSYPKNNF